MKSFSVVSLSLPFVLTFSLTALGAESPTLTKPARPDLVTVQSPAPVPNVNAGLVGDVEKMLHGGADAAVVKAYIQNWTGRYYVTADQILHLHDVGATTEVLTALIQRSGELRAQSTPAPAPAPNLVTANPAPAQVVDETPPAVVYPYPATYPAYTYSYLYPSIYPSYSYWWSVPYSYSYSYWPWYRGYGWGGYRYYGWNRGPYYRYPYSHGYAWGRPGHPGYNGSWRGGGGYTHAIGSRPGGWNGGGFRGGVGVGVGVGHGGGFRGGGGGGGFHGGGGGGRH